MSTYQLRKIGHALRVGDARIEGIAYRGSHDERVWIVTLLDEQRVVHVPVAARPSWIRYREVAS